MKTLLEKSEVTNEYYCDNCDSQVPSLCIQIKKSPIIQVGYQRNDTILCSTCLQLLLDKLNTAQQIQDEADLTLQFQERLS